MSRGIDYSKWDHLDVSSDDDDDKAAASQTHGHPRVTRLDQPSRITTQADGSLLVQPQQEQQQQQQHLSLPFASSKKPGKKDAPDEDVTKTPRAPSISNNMAEAYGGQQSPDSIPTADYNNEHVPAQWIDKGGQTTLTIAEADENLQSLKLYWSQDRYSVTLRIQLPPTAASATIKWDVRIQGMLSYSDRHCAVAGGAAPVLQIFQQQQPKHGSNRSDKIKNVWWQDELPHPVHRAQDDNDDNDEGCSVDWCIETVKLPRHDGQQQRYLTISLFKAVPMHGLSLWWKRPVATCPEIELTWRQEEISSGGGGGSFQQAWNEAHDQFRKQVLTTKETRG